MSVNTTVRITQVPPAMGSPQWFLCLPEEPEPEVADEEYVPRPDWSKTMWHRCTLRTGQSGKQFAITECPIERRDYVAWHGPQRTPTKDFNDRPVCITCQELT